MERGIFIRSLSLSLWMKKSYLWLIIVLVLIIAAGILVFKNKGEAGLAPSDNCPQVVPLSVAVQYFENNFPVPFARDTAPDPNGYVAAFYCENQFGCSTSSCKYDKGTGVYITESGEKVFNCGCFP